MQASFQTKPTDSRRFRLPRTHTIAVVVATCLLGLALLPSEEASAKRRSSEVALSFKSEATPQSEVAPTNAIIEGTDNTGLPSFNEQASNDSLASLNSEPELNWRAEKVRSGDNLTTLFKRASLSARDVYQVMSAGDQSAKLTKMKPGESLRLGLDNEGALQQLVYQRSQLESFHFERSDDGYTSRQVLREPELLTTYRTATIDDSLFLAADKADIPHNLIMELANIFGWDIDFVFDIRKGDQFAVLYEEKFLDGEKIGTGNILAAEFTNQGKTYRAVRYESEGHASYYTPEGLSMRKAFLRAPLDVFRISSNFNLRRKHPIHKKIKAHRGVDYAAPRGTPVYAAGNGKVIAAGYSKANGNYVFIQHGQRYVTKYLHLHKRYVRKGQTVTQRKTIGTVGSTGYATGPHLHYEFLVNGVHRNPRTVKLPQAKPVASQQLASFKQATSPLLAQLDNYNQKSQLAMVTPDDKSLVGE